MVAIGYFLSYILLRKEKYMVDSVTFTILGIIAVMITATFIANS